ncbi:glycosyltransferase family 4 protein [Kitasatospora sp. NPDC056181]|uniref:glycosyltransferase family 4 protein n=1 Tax=Kitasatospora sp. NPDC056181 TaxID=3345737 RepID=UPI0035DBE0C9
MTFTERTPGDHPLGDGRAFGHRDVSLIEPPVNTAGDAPGQVDGTAFRREHGIGEDELLLAIVTRLVPALEKDAGVELTVDAVRRLDDPKVRLAIVGAGPSLERTRTPAAAVNAELRRQAVLVPGQLADPRPAYQAADVVLGMGGSALRGLAFGKPVVVHGAAGYTAVHEPGPLVEPHASRCMYGFGDGSRAPEALAGQLRGLLHDPGHRARLGSWGREWVVGRFSLESVTSSFEELYGRVLARPARVTGWLKDLEQMTRYEFTKPAALRLLGR